MEREEAQEMFDGMRARGEEHPQAAFDWGSLTFV